MEYVQISPPFLSSARPLSEPDREMYARESARLIQVVGKENFQCGIFNSLGDYTSARANCMSLYYHQLEQQNPESSPSPFLAIFKKPMIRSLQHFYELQITHLQAMHNFDQQHFQVKPYAIHSGDEKKFEFAIGGRIYGIGELHCFKENFTEYYDRVVLVFTVKHQGRQVFAPRYMPSTNANNHRKVG